MAERTCKNCGTSLEGRKSHAECCSAGCRATYSRNKRKNNQLMGFPKSYPGNTTQMPQAGNSGVEIFLLQERIKELTEEKRNLNTKLEAYQDKVDKLKDKLKDKELEMMANEKPTGLGGLDADMITTLIGNAPQLLEQLGKMAGSKGGSELQGLDIKKQNYASKFIQHLSTVDEEQSDHFWAIMQMALQGNEEKAKQLIITYKTKYNNHGTKAING